MGEAGPHQVEVINSEYRHDATTPRRHAIGSADRRGVGRTRMVPSATLETRSNHAPAQSRQEGRDAETTLTAPSHPILTVARYSSVTTPVGPAPPDPVAT